MGYKIQKKDLVFKRPGTGISPMDVNKIIGKKLKMNIKMLKTKLKRSTNMLHHGPSQVPPITVRVVVAISLPE